MATLPVLPGFAIVATQSDVVDNPTPLVGLVIPSAVNAASFPSYITSLFTGAMPVFMMQEPGFGTGGFGSGGFGEGTLGPVQILWYATGVFNIRIQVTAPSGFGEGNFGDGSFGVASVIFDSGMVFASAIFGSVVLPEVEPGNFTIMITGYDASGNVVTAFSQPVSVTVQFQIPSSD